MRTFILMLAVLSFTAIASNQARIRDITRVDGVRENSLVGYGIVVGLAGSGDSSRNKATLQSIRNTLENFGVAVSNEDIKSNNAAAVIVTADLNAFAQPGDKIDVHVSSLGDARSLTGGTLYITPLKGVDDKIYALAQGNLSTGGYKFEQNQNVVQRNHPTVGFIPQGAIVEKEIDQQFVRNNQIQFVLNQPDFVTAESMVQVLKQNFPELKVRALHAGKVAVSPVAPEQAMMLIAQIQQLRVQTASIARVVVNEKTGTVVAGADVTIGDVVISHAGIRLEIQTRFRTSQPGAFSGINNPAVRTETVPETDVKIAGEREAYYASQGGTNIAELVAALKKVNLSTRDIISILQAINQSGALNAELIVQ